MSLAETVARSACKINTNINLLNKKKLRAVLASSTGLILFRCRTLPKLAPGSHYEVPRYDTSNANPPDWHESPLQVPSALPPQP